MRNGGQRSDCVRAASDYAERVADAIVAVYPERALEILDALLKEQLGRATPSSDRAAVDTSRKIHAVYTALGRTSGWVALLGSLRATYGERIRCLDMIDKFGAETRTPTPCGPYA
jgi:uncharacterized Zn finger protein